MSWENREYAQDRPWRDALRIAGIAMPTGVVRSLVIAHLAFFAIVLALRAWGPPALHPYLYGIHKDQAPPPLTILLHPFTPGPDRWVGGAIHVFFVCLMVAAFGRLVAAHRGDAAALLTYILGNAVTGGAYVAAAYLAPPLAAAPLDYPVGALAAWSAWAIRTMRWEYVLIGTRTYPLAGVIAFAAALVALVQLLAYGPGAALWLIAALLGASADWIVAAMQRISADRPATSPRTLKIRRTSPAPTERPPANARIDDELDRLLEKIGRSGIDSLSPDERERLEAARQAKLRASSSR
jgi:hypothetical protein